MSCRVYIERRSLARTITYSYDECKILRNVRLPYRIEFLKSVVAMVKLTSQFTDF